MPSTGIFIAGTDTDAGKTYIGTRLTRYLIQQGIQVSPRKPAESGCEPSAESPAQLHPRDAYAYAETIKQPEALAQICPYRYSAALAPSIAAVLEDKELTIEMLTQACNVDDDEFLLVEGAGGFYSPLASDGLNADLAVRLGLPVLLAGANRLGCINHVLLTVEAIKRRGLQLIGVALTAVEAGEASSDSNAQAIREYIDSPVIAIPHNATDSDLQRCFSELNIKT